MKLRAPDQIDISPVDFQALLNFVLERFHGDEVLRDSILRLREVASRLGRPMSYFPTGLSPTFEWPGGGEKMPGEEGLGDEPVPASLILEEGIAQGEASEEGDWIVPPADPISPQPKGHGNFLSFDHISIDDLIEACKALLSRWTLEKRRGEELPVDLESLNTVDGGELETFALPLREEEEPEFGARLVRVIKAQTELALAPSVALMVHGGSVYLSAMSSGEPEGARRGKVLHAVVPPPGSDFEPFQEINPIEEGFFAAQGDGPYGEEALATGEHVTEDLVGKLASWALAERDEEDLPPEMMMYDAGTVWRHKGLPPTELKRPSIARRVKEVAQIIAEVAPAPAAVSFVHRKKLYVLSGASMAPGDIVLRLLRFEIPPPGSQLGEPEVIKFSEIGLDDVEAV